MPESPLDKLYAGMMDPPSFVAPCALDYAELDVTSNFTFLHGASHPDEMVYTAALLGYRAIAITDVNTLAGVVRAWEAAKKPKLKMIVGTRLVFTDAPDLLVWPCDRAAYGRLCRLLTTGRRRAPKGECHLQLSDFIECNQGFHAAVVLPPSGPLPLPEGEGETAPDPTRRQLQHLRDALGDRLSLVASAVYDTDDRSHLDQLDRLSRELHIPLLTTNAVHYHDPGRRPLQDVLTCVRHGCTIEEAGFKLFPNGERYLKSPAQMHRLFAAYPQAIRRGIEIAEACTFDLGDLKYEYPNDVVPADRSMTAYLRELTYAGAAARYPRGVPGKVVALLEKELTFIAGSKYEPYFLTVWDLVRFARSRGILCQGRGSAANSAVCYCLGVTSVDPDKFQLVFERFASSARQEPPDIDIDFEHERREEVIQYLYQKYGRERAGMTGGLITYRGRSAVRDVGKALGLSLDMITGLADKLDWWHRGTLTRNQLIEAGVDPLNPTIQRLIHLTSQVLGFPRHLSQHVGGMVISRGPLCEVVPIENAAMEDRTVIEWDKDDIDAVGIFKVDCLALGMLTAISKALGMIEQDGKRSTLNAQLSTLNRRAEKSGTSNRMRDGASSDFPVECWKLSVECWKFSPLQYGPHPSPLPEGEGTREKLELHTIPSDDPAVYDMISDADTVGVFQIESRAQMSMLPRLRPREYYDLVIEVAIVRPGPIQGNMVHPYLKRRTGEEPVVYPKEELRDVLEKTLGVPLFQEQAMRLAIVAAGFSGAEADELRRAMAAWKRKQGIEKFHDKFVNGMLARGYEKEFAENCFSQICGFGEYGFPESHAASFALLVYASAWIKRHHPAVFCAALLNSQPMGFYAPAQLVRDAKEHGVEVRAIDVNCSEWDCLLEDPGQSAVAAFPPLPPGEGRGEGPTGENAAPSGDVRTTSPHPNPLPEGEGTGGKSTWGLNGPAVRLGFRQLKGFRQAHAQQIVATRMQSGAFHSIEDFQRRSRLPVSVIRQLAEGDAFGSLGITRRQAVWLTLPLRDQDAPLFDTPSPSFPSCLGASVPSCLPPMPLGQEVMTDYSTAGLSLKRHPVWFARGELVKRKIITTSVLQDGVRCPHGRWVKVAGLVLVRQRPGTASGVVFITIEDESGVANLILWSRVYDQYRLAARHATLLQADGYVQREGQVVHVLVKRLFDLSDLISGYGQRSRDFH